MDKSYVTMEQHVCVVCGHAFDTGALLLDRRLKDTFEHKTITGHGICPEDKAKIDEGYVALVEIDPAKSTISGDVIKPGDEYRTGEAVFLKLEAAQQLFRPVPEGRVVYVEPGVIEKLKSQIEGGA